MRRSCFFWVEICAKFIHDRFFTLSVNPFVFVFSQAGTTGLCADCKWIRVTNSQHSLSEDHIVNWFDIGIHWRSRFPWLNCCCHRLIGLECLDEFGSICLSPTVLRRKSYYEWGNTLQIHIAPFLAWTFKYFIPYKLLLLHFDIVLRPECQTSIN